MSGFFVDERGGILIATGPETDLKEIEDLVQSLDVEKEGQAARRPGFRPAGRVRPGHSGYEDYDELDGFEEGGEDYLPARLEGNWQLDVPLWQRLNSTDDARPVAPGEFSAEKYEFRRDPSLAAKIQAEFDELQKDEERAHSLKDKRIFLSGVMRVGRVNAPEREWPFFVITYQGTIRVMYYEPRRGIGEAVDRWRGRHLRPRSAEAS